MLKYVLIFHIAMIVTILILGYIDIRKIDRTGDCRAVIIEAIYKYRCECIDAVDTREIVDYDDMESFEATLSRFWDWGYTRILPKDKYELIKPYIEKDNLKGIKQ